MCSTTQNRKQKQQHKTKKRHVALLGKGGGHCVSVAAVCFSFWVFLCGSTQKPKTNTSHRNTMLTPGPKSATPTARQPAARAASQAAGQLASQAAGRPGGRPAARRPACQPASEPGSQPGGQSQKCCTVPKIPIFLAKTV